MRILVVTTAVALLLAGCAAAAPAPPPATPVSAAPGTDTSPDAATAAFLVRHQLDGLTPRQIVERLDSSQDDREDGPIGSVRPSELVLSDQDGEVVVPMPDDAFYLAVAPYRERTHDCYNHNLATCQGELVEEVLTVRVVDASGAAVVDQEVTTRANGFAGVWLPRNLKGTLTVGHDGDTATTRIATGPEDPTCLTTLRLG